MPEVEFFENSISKILAGGEQTVLVCDEGGIKGYALFKLIETGGADRPARKVCFIDCFAVEENSRRQGIGGRLFEGVKKYAAEQGCNALQLGVDAENESARAFYKKMGLLPRLIIMAADIL